VPNELCADRARLLQPVLDAIEERWRAKATYDSAKRKKASNVDTLVIALHKGSEVEHVAKRALRGHVEHHGCRV
jgi:SUMO ligase MMS21 Smc5/6 complex component